ncbi:helix-turn-helix transcriptional regulator [uncultured Catenibacterium sp.]|uniref:helix-turn-helix domain-containing protein n=1 Tax=uncultured Catenibacterium sp. TaxID=286142 RepID=UPI0025CD6865|nr:helix-turn-helix transcriptional regulator [uncultured Catenibacterium sp.]
MEFNEKLKELRNSRGLTQEELASALFVSRTAISKWESGRGNPSIDSLKEISSFFSITLDELLSGEKLLLIAEKENQIRLQNTYNLLIGMIDLCYFLLIVLPLYPKTIGLYIASVNLFEYVETSAFNQKIYWALFLLIMLNGITEIILTKLKDKDMLNKIVGINMILSILAVIFLALTGETYATALSFLFLLLKASLYMKGRKSI